MDKNRILALCNHILSESGKIGILATEPNVAHFREVQLAAHEIAAEIRKPDEPKENKPDEPKKQEAEE